MKKILIIGQAPPAVKQEYPYDTTLLYDIFQWVGIGKIEALNIFNFDALVDQFPGHSVGGGHLKPSKAQILEYYHRSLKLKIENAEKVILLGNPSRDFLKPEFKEYGIYENWLFLPHPSKRNYNLIMNKKPEITEMLKNFL